MFVGENFTSIFYGGMHDRSMRSGTKFAREIQLTDWSTAGNLSNRSSGVQIPRDICTRFKQLLDEVFVISRIIKVEVGVISRSRRLRLITLTETLIILDITKTESNNCFIIPSNAKTWKSCFCFFTDGKPESREVDMITLGNHALRSYMT